MSCFTSAVERSLNLFVSSLDTLYWDDDRVKIKSSSIYCKDEFRGFDITWILDVASSIRKSAGGDPHLTLSVTHQPEEEEKQVETICIMRGDNLPIGDSLTSWLLAYHSGDLTYEVRTCERAAMRACGLLRSTHLGRGEARVAAWGRFYEDMIQQPQSDYDRVDAFMQHQLDERIFITRQLMAIPTEELEFFNEDDRLALVKLLLEHCDCHNTLRAVIASVGGSGNWQYIHPLSTLLSEVPDDNRVIRAAEYAINRLKESFFGTTAF